MAYALNNVTTSDDYTTEATLECSGSVQLDIIVANAAVYYSYAVRSRNGLSGSAVVFGPDIFLPPGMYTRARPAEAVRVRSAVAGEPAQVSIEAVLFHEMIP